MAGRGKMEFSLAGWHARVPELDNPEQWWTRCRNPVVLGSRHEETPRTWAIPDGLARKCKLRHCLEYIRVRHWKLYDNASATWQSTA